MGKHMIKTENDSIFGKIHTILQKNVVFLLYIYFTYRLFHIYYIKKWNLLSIVKAKKGYKNL